MWRKEKTAEKDLLCRIGGGMMVCEGNVMNERVSETRVMNIVSFCFTLFVCGMVKENSKKS